ncbi:MAG TPA: hypothetical protein VFP72_09350 [Kineosporiaceae bacterium]|nr:hypothetical protein [Kineosporiaceae bacterium]
MSGRQSRRRGDERPPEEWLGDLLRREAEQYEPDRARILARMAEGERALAEIKERKGRRRGWLQRAFVPQRTGARQSGGLGGHFAWPVVAAGLAVVTVAGVAGARVVAGHSPVPAPPAATATGARSLGPALTLPSETASARATTTAAPTPTVTPSTSTPAKPSTSTAVALWPNVWIGVQPVPNGAQVSFPRPGDKDWLLIGSRSDGKVVRMKSASRPITSVTASGNGAGIVDSPFRINFTGGIPESARDGDVTWQSASAVDGRIQVVIPLRPDKFTLDLFTGTVKTSALVKVRLEGGSTQQLTQNLLQACSTDVCPGVASVYVDASYLPADMPATNLVVEIVPEHPGSGLGFGLAAVAVR